MNAEPHTHEVVIVTGDHVYRITYGDTTSYVRTWWFFIPLDRRLRRRVPRVIAQHDRGSVEAGRRQDLADRIEEEFNGVPEPKPAPELVTFSHWFEAVGMDCLGAPAHFLVHGDGHVEQLASVS